KRRAAANDVMVHFIQADAHQLPFADESFDAVWGNAVLHHFDLAVAGREIRRVLRPNGVAVFCEPWAGNPLLRCARRWLPYSGKKRTPDEVPLRLADLSFLRKMFPNLRWQGFQLFSMVGRAMPVSAVSQPLGRCDAFVLRHVPMAKKWCRYVVLTLPR